MSMSRAQQLLFPDPRPLVERLGTEFFKELPQSAGVYVMRDMAGVTLYVGKAKSLRDRVRSYCLRAASEDAKTGSLMREAVDVEDIVVMLRRGPAP